MIIHCVGRKRNSIWNVVWIGTKPSSDRVDCRGLMMRDSLRNLGFEPEKVRGEIISREKEK